MKIYFDGTEINNSIVTGLSYDGKMFNDDEVFTLGGTICETASIKVIKSAVSQHPSVVSFTENNITKTFNVDNISEDNNEYVYTLVDNMVKFNFRYDAQPLIEASQHTEPDGTKYVYLVEIVEDICDKIGINLTTQTFLGYQKHITWYDNTITAREYIGMVAELNAGYALIINQNLVFKQFSNTPSFTISVSNCEEYNVGEGHTITRIAMENGMFAPVGTDTGTTIYLDPNNVFITEQSDLTNIYNILNGYEYYSISASCNLELNEIGSCFAISDGTNNYKGITQISADYNGGWYGKCHFIIGSNEKQETAIYSGTEDNYKRLKLQVDRDKNEIGLLAETKVDNADYKKSEIIARINNGVGEAVINADCISLAGKTFNLTTDNISISSTNFNVTTDGTVISKAGKIANFNIDDDGFSQSYYPKYNYSQTDVDRIRAILLGQIQPTDEDYEKYDLDNSGTITTRDLLAISKFIIFGITTTNPMNIKIKNGAYVTDSAFVISVGTGANEIEYTKISLNSVQTNSLNTDRITAGNIDCGTVNVPDAGITVQFNKTFSSPPVVVITPNTTKAGIIAMKVQNVTTTSFDIAIGGSTYFNGVDTNWIAIG